MLSIARADITAPRISLVLDLLADPDAVFFQVGRWETEHGLLSDASSLTVHPGLLSRPVKHLVGPSQHLPKT